VGGDEEALRWEIASLRTAISDDWVALASRQTADPEKRKAVRDHLDMSTCALRAATEKLEALLRRRRGLDSQGILIDLQRMADEIMLPEMAATAPSRLPS
jgi:hypothetical protein